MNDIKVFKINKTIILFILSCALFMCNDKISTSKEKITKNNFREGELTKFYKDMYLIKGYSEEPSLKNNGLVSCAYGVLTNEGWVVIDALTMPELSKKFVDQLFKVKNVPVKYLIITHYHHDHWFGAKTFKILKSKIIAHKKLMEYYESGRGELVLNALRKRFKGLYVNSELIAPDMTIDKKFSLNVGEKIFELIPFDSSHSSADLVVYMPKEKLIFVGDLIMQSRVTGMQDNHARSKGLVKVLQELNKYDIQMVLGGHDAPMQKSSIDYMINYVNYLRNNILKMKELDYSIDKIKANLQNNPYKKLPLYDLLHNGNIMKIFDELDWDGTIK